MTSRRADDLPRQIAKLQQKVAELDRRASRQGHNHGFMLLAEATADGTSTNLEVTSIPQTHRDLLVTVHGANVGTVLRAVTVRLNGDSGSNYRWIRIVTLDNGSPTTGSSQSATSWNTAAFGDDTDLNSLRLEIPDYSAARNHAFTSQAYGSQGSAAGNSQYTSAGGAHISAAAVTQITAIMGTDNWKIGSTLRVYGLGLI